MNRAPGPRKSEAGMPPEEADSEALKRFGAVESPKEIGRDHRGVVWFDELGQDFRFAVRMLAKNKALSAVIVLTLGLGIGANTAVFSLVSAALIRPLPYPAPDQLVQIQNESQPFWATKPEVSSIFGFPELSALKERNQVFSQMGLYAFRGVNLGGTDGAERLLSGRVSLDFFSVFGARLLMGRAFLPEEDRPDGPLVAVLSHGLWQKRFGGDREVLGRVIRLDDVGYTVVGVLAPGFAFTQSFDLYVPLAFGPVRRGREFDLPAAVGRLKPGVSLAQARTALDIIYKSAANPKDKGHIVLAGLAEYLTGGSRKALLVYLGAVVFVLLIACANVANLLLARAANRRREVGIRVALGASRLRIVRQFLTESVLLATLGGICGLVLASCTKDLLRAAIPQMLSICVIRIDGWVLAFTLVIALGTGILFGLAPAVEAARQSLGQSLKEGDRAGGMGGHSQRRLSRWLVVSEIGLAAVLLLSACLLIKSFLKVRGVDSGFRPDRILSLTIPLTKSKYPDGRVQTEFFERVIDGIRALPGVEAVGANGSLPLTWWSSSISGLEIEGHPPLTGPDKIFSTGIVNGDYFRAMGIPLKKGRCFTNQDRSGAPEVLMVSESFESHYFPGDTAVGKRLLDDNQPWTIVGVVGDVRQGGPEDQPGSMLYRSFLHAGSGMMSLAVRTRGDPMAVAPMVQTVVRGVDRDQPIENMMPMEQRIAGVLAPRRLNMLLSAALGTLAILLASVGVYGLLSFSAAQRRHEIGVRMALGACRNDVLKMMLMEGVKLAAAGTAFGLLAAFGLSHFLAGLLYGISPLDPETYVVTALLLPLIALVACCLPARQAASVDPMSALKNE